MAVFAVGVASPGQQPIGVDLHPGTSREDTQLCTFRAG